MITTLESGMQRRTELLLGSSALSRLNNARVLIFGVGGVGSWCAECLVRSGIRHITIVDSDRVCFTNCNRQLMATSKTVGQVKVNVLKNRLLEINPNLDIDAQQRVYDASSAESFKMETYDFIVDAIDSLSEKADLILRATSLPKNITLISSMGAALRRDPFKVRKAEFWNVKGDALARALRNRFKRIKTYPSRKFICVYSEETPMQNLGECSTCGLPDCICAQNDDVNNWSVRKAQINGSLCHITAIFGMSIAGIVINRIVDSE